MYGICQLVLGMLPRKTGTSGKFGVQGQQQVLSDYNMFSVLFSFLINYLGSTYIVCFQPAKISIFRKSKRRSNFPDFKDVTFDFPIAFCHLEVIVRLHLNP